MDISKLTIQGFKSFYEKSVFTFGKDITAIVGPNGSGKSNITESIRFVLGEQSAKAMRGKDVSDMLYRGNSTRVSKAKVEIEFVKNTKQGLTGKGNTENVFVKEMLDKDVVTVSRTVYADGKSEYSMNGVEVRVKDLHEFLLFIHLGNKSSWHISQGEADRVLQANNLERKTIIEDALGLKVYHSRINESQKKMEKTRENIREASIKRRELVPELNALGKQVERIKRSADFRKDLGIKASVYLHHKKNALLNLKSEDTQSESLESLQNKFIEIEQTLAQKEKNLYKDGGHDTSFLEHELSKEESLYKHIKSAHANLESSFRNSENNLQYLNIEETRNLEELRKIESELANVSHQGNDIIFAEKNVTDLRDTIELNTEKIINSTDLGFIHTVSKDTDFSYKKLLSMGAIVNKDNVKQISYLQGIKNRLQEKVQALRSDKTKFSDEVKVLEEELQKSELKLKLVNDRIEIIKKQIIEYKLIASETERELQSLNFERSNTQIKIAQKQNFLQKLLEIEKEYHNELHDFKQVLGNSFDLHPENLPNDISNTLNDEEILNLRRSIERLKIRLEESQVTNPDEVIQNFETLTEKDNFLLKEISDLENSMTNLENLINDLKQSLKQEFDIGLLHINTVFDSYVKRLFGGGGGKVFVVEIENKKKSDTTAEDSSTTLETEDEKDEPKTGIEVEVEIPKKKIKGLHSLSGGERALISIALNFSIINQNPAPFMILDETDAALDEANSKRYGEILEMLKKQTKLIVVTHNRETMHFSDQVYGVTLGKEGFSKVLSVSFEDAIEYAK